MKNNNFDLVKIKKILLRKGYKVYRKSSSSFFQSKLKCRLKNWLIEL